MGEFVPVALRRVGTDKLQIQWSDGLVQEVSAAGLRAACPCAACRRQSSSPSAGAGVEPASTVTITSMKPAGNYAYQIRFSDGHATGLFTFDLLRSLT